MLNVVHRNLTDLDDRIAQLERELQAGSEDDSASDFLRILVRARSVRRFLRAFASATFLIERAFIACACRVVVSARAAPPRFSGAGGHLHCVARAAKCFRWQLHAIAGRPRVLALVVKEPLLRNREGAAVGGSAWLRAPGAGAT